MVKNFIKYVLLISIILVSFSLCEQTSDEEKANKKKKSLDLNNLKSDLYLLPIGNNKGFNTFKKNDMSPKDKNAYPSQSGKKTTISKDNSLTKEAQYLMKLKKACKDAEDYHACKHEYIKKNWSQKNKKTNN
jgi:hypothetical protein